MYRFLGSKYSPCVFQPKDVAVRVLIIFHMAKVFDVLSDSLEQVIVVPDY